MSTVTYVRTLEFNYGECLGKVEFNKLAKDLQDKGITIVDRYQSNDVEYGYQEVFETKTRFGIVDLNQEEILSYNYRSEADKVVTAFNNHGIELTLSTIETTSSSKKWRPTKGSVLYFDTSILNLEGEQSNWYGRELTYDLDDSTVDMACTLRNGSEGMVLKFEIEWDCKNIKRKDAIEAAMVDVPLADIAVIQNAVESRLKLKKYGYGDEPEINCHFDAKTESRSECTPDIIQKIKDAKKNA
jgi:hypothetical protein